MKKISFVILAFVFMIAGLIIPMPQAALADSWRTAVTFRGFGDSISAGDTLPDNENYVVGENITQGCYTEVLSRSFISEFGGSAVNFAQSGDKTSGGESGGMVTKLAPYTNQTAEDYQDFYNTDVITVCIGANNVLSPAVSDLPTYLMGTFGEEQEQTLRTKLQAGLDDFENDYLNTILPTLTTKTSANTKVYVMTIYNPYKYTHLYDAQVSETDMFKDMIRGMIGTEQAPGSMETKFQQILAIAMEYLAQVNQIIRTNTTDKVHCVDIYNLFETFTKEQYLQYINADLSKLTLSFSIISNPSTVMAYADPHPTLLGQEVIANEFAKQVVVSSAQIDTSLSGNISTDSQIQVSINTFGSSNLSYKLYARINNQDTLLYSGTNTTCQVVASDLTTSGVLYFDIYSGETKISSSNQVAYAITFEEETPDDPTPDDPTPDDPTPETPTDDKGEQKQDEKTENKTPNITVIAIVAVGGVIVAGIVTFFIIKSVRM